MKFVGATKQICDPHQIPTYTALQQQITPQPLWTRNVTSRRHPFLSTLIKQLAAIIAVITLLFGLWFGVATYLAPRPSYPYYDTQKPLPPWSEPTPLAGNRDRAGEHR